MIKLYYYKILSKNDNKVYVLSADNTSDFYSRLFKFYRLDKNDVIIEKINDENIARQLELEL